MAISDDQLSLLTTARNALHGWQDTAAGVDVVLQQIVMNFPSPEGKDYTVTFTWDADRELFDISS
jgi:hypothetical protein